ncbi:HNH endonuclease [Methylobacterium sp. J-059]|uniref:HNH endonuclease n=1 Tax=Methylobacterium sp. J-059 TaxID=2836643 RepID=UPI001FBA19CB|nr:HNH endonuclease [Methylobacterium sp. J-059]MCJ2038813.1 HNH endonuclease [Methylobacterium sp. J-059]
MTDYPLLPITLPEFVGSHPFSRGQNPKLYTPEELRDRGIGKTARTDFFERYLAAIYWALEDAVPYAFRTADGTVRSLDAGCLKFLLNRNRADLTFDCGPDGKIVSVTPGRKLLELYLPIRDRLIDEILVRSAAGRLLSSTLDLRSIAPEIQARFDPDFVIDERRRVESERVIREGAAQFRKAVLNAWSGKCAITGTDIDVVLDAAHIYPYLGPKTNDVSNGIALRSDLHRLFDRGLLAIRLYDSIARVEMIGKLAGGAYGAFTGVELMLPTGRCCPDSRLLEWHRRRAEMAAGTD